MKRIFLLIMSVVLLSCNQSGIDKGAPVSDSGVSKTSVVIPTNSQGLTTEQQNVRDRLLEDNKVGAIKHLYVISAYSGQTLVYSTVRGKVTSSGKRLTPETVAVTPASDLTSRFDGFDVKFGGEQYQTGEVLQDDGTYGTSVEYLYWWDTKGIYHQHYVSGGQIIHISSEPLSVKSIVINMELE